MTNADRILQFLRSAGGPVCDDCVSQHTGVKPRQQVNQLAARLSDAHQIWRGFGPACTHCGAPKKVSSTHPLSLVQPASPVRIPTSTPARPLAVVAPPSATDAGESRPWHWEGNVQAVLRRYLEAADWTVTKVANTASKEAGVDLAATKDGRELLFEVKGFPSNTYEHGIKRGLAKPTQPSNQARQWYSHAMLSVMRLREKQPDAGVVLCLPDFPTYRKLVEGTSSSLALLGVGVYLVSPSGAVVELLLSRVVPYRND